MFALGEQAQVEVAKEEQAKECIYWLQFNCSPHCSRPKSCRWALEQEINWARAIPHSSNSNCSRPLCIGRALCWPVRSGGVRIESRKLRALLKQSAPKWARMHSHTQTLGNKPPRRAGSLRRPSSVRLAARTTSGRQLALLTERRPICVCVCVCVSSLESSSVTTCWLFRPLFDPNCLHFSRHNTNQSPSLSNTSSSFSTQFEQMLAKKERRKKRAQTKCRLLFLFFCSAQTTSLHQN